MEVKESIRIELQKKMKKKMELSNALRLAEIYMYVVVVLKQWRAQSSRERKK